MLFSALSAVVVVVLAPLLVPAVGLTTVLAFLGAELVGTALVTLASNLRIVASGYRAALGVQLVPQVVKVAIIVALAIAGHLTLTIYGVTYLACSVVVGVVVFSATTRSIGVSRRPRAIRGEDVRTTLSMSSTIWAWGLHDNGDKLVMSANKLGPDVGLYAAGYKLVQFGNIPVNALATSSFRSFLDPNVGNQTKRAVRLSLAITVYTATAALGIIVLAPVALPILVGNGFHGSITMARWLAPLLITRGILTFPGNALVGLGRTHARLAAYATSAIVGMGIYIWLVPSMSWKGAIIGSYVTDFILVTMLWGLLLTTRRPVAPAAPTPEYEQAALEYAEALEYQEERAQD
jgi:O-antigen/teichoic acid export membrane protein